MINTTMLKLLVPYVQFGDTVTEQTWETVMKFGPMASLSFSGAMRFFWYAVCGWSFAEFGTNGVLFVKEADQPMRAD